MDAKNKKPIFPKSFLWGASTAAHQVEGGTINQWTVWELAHAKQLAKTAHERLGRLPNWEEIKDQAEDPNNYVSGEGINHYQRYEEDFDLLKELKLNAFRFSIEWSRIEPEEGKWASEELAHYSRYIRELRERNITPMLCLWHWTLPTWFTDKGGFKKRSNLKYFERFVQKISEEYGNEISHIITLNEPNVYSVKSYFDGVWPPQEKNLLSVIKVYLNLVSAHKRAYKILKTRFPHLQIGAAIQLGNIQAKRPHNFLDEISTKAMRYIWNWWFLLKIRRYQDFVGFNYYFTDYFSGFFKRQNPSLPLNDLGWYAEPEGLYPLLVRVWARFKKPIIITENGIADANDSMRQWWLQETIIALERALSEGVSVQGYFHWSLLDNFEWADGWWPKFGLVGVDRQNGMKRTVRPSAKWLAKQISQL